MSDPKLLVIVASTRPGRIGLPIGQWFFNVATAHGGFSTELVDLAEWDLPLMDEPHHPRLRQYTHEHTRRWSALIDAASALVWVMPEYNHGYTAPLKNAIGVLIHEWAWKPVGLVSYGGLSAGTRATQLLKPVLSDLKMVPVAETVAIPFVSQLMTDGVFEATESLDRSARAMLDALVRVEVATRVLRAPAVTA